MSDEVAITLITSLCGLLSTVLTIGARRLAQNTAAVRRNTMQVLLLRAAVSGESVDADMQVEAHE